MYPIGAKLDFHAFMGPEGLILTYSKKKNIFLAQIMTELEQFEIKENL